MKNEQNKEDFPGYPHYPGNEDITRASKNSGKVHIDADKPAAPFNNTVDEQDFETRIVPGTEADVTEEDLKMLEYAAQNITESDLHRASLDNLDDDGTLLDEGGSLSSNTAGDSLDVPGSEDDDAQEMIGSEDEENNYYSLGGDNHDSLEESRD